MANLKYWSLYVIWQLSTMGYVWITGKLLGLLK